MIRSQMENGWRPSLQRPSNDVSISKSNRLLHTIPPSHIILTKPLYFAKEERYPLIYCMSGIGSITETDMLSSASCTLATSLSLHVLIKRRPSIALWTPDGWTALFQRLSARRASSWVTRFVWESENWQSSEKASYLGGTEPKWGERSPYACSHWIKRSAEPLGCLEAQLQAWHCQRA